MGCTCDAGFSGAHCDSQKAAFTISGTYTWINGVYSQTAHVCNGKPVYQKGGEDGFVLYQPDSGSSWNVGSYGSATKCDDHAYIIALDGRDASPDGAGCAGKWLESGHHSGETCHYDGSWCRVPAIKVAV